MAVASNTSINEGIMGIAFGNNGRIQYDNLVDTSE